MQNNSAVSELLNNYYNTDNEADYTQAIQLCIDNNYMFDYICASARIHDNNNLYWSVVTGIADFNSKCLATGLSGCEEQITTVLIAHNISVQQLDAADEVEQNNNPEYDNIYSAN